MRSVIEKGLTENTFGFKQSSDREDWLDLVKFIGISLVVMSHLEISIPVAGQMTSLFFVPVFFMAAGYTYHRKEESFFNFVARKASRLLLPYFGYSFFFYFFYAVKTGQLALRPFAGIFYSRMFLYPPDMDHNILFLTVWNSPLWYLTAMFLSLLLFECCIRISGGNDIQLGAASAVCFGIGILLRNYLEILLPWSLETAFLFEGIIFTGYLIKKNSLLEITATKNLLAVLLIPLLIFMGYANAPAIGAVNVSVGNFGRNVLVGAMNAIVSSAAVMYLCHLCRRQVPAFLVEAGRSSLTIMCLHLFLYMFLKTGLEIVFKINIEGDGAVPALFRIAAAMILIVILTVFDRMVIRSLSAKLKRPFSRGESF